MLDHDELDAQAGEEAAKRPTDGDRYGSGVTPCGCAIRHLEGVGEERGRSDERVDDEPELCGR